MMVKEKLINYQYDIYVSLNSHEHNSPHQRSSSTDPTDEELPTGNTNG